MMYTVYKNDPTVDHLIEIARLDSDEGDQDYRMTDLIDIALWLPDLKHQIEIDFPDKSKRQYRGGRLRNVRSKAHDPNEGIIEFPSMSYTILPDQYIPD